MLLGVRKSPLSVDIFGGWVCFTEGKDIHVVQWDQSGDFPVVILEKAHHSNVTVVRFTQTGDVLSASSDAIVLWKRSRDGSFNAGKYLLKDLSESVQQIRISSSGLRLAVALGSTVLILDAVVCTTFTHFKRTRTNETNENVHANTFWNFGSQSGDPKAQLDAHKAAVTDVCFFPLNERRIITISEDCTFKV
jgi:WD40 repeat protein